MHATVKTALMSMGTTLVLLTLSGLAQAHDHFDAHAKIKGKADGKHLLHTTTHGHTAHAQINNGKVKSVSVTHKGKSVALTKFKSTKKLHAMAPGASVSQFALLNADEAVSSFASTTDEDTGEHELASVQLTTFIGWGFFNSFTNQWVVFWFPVTVVDNGEFGAIVFNNPPAIVVQPAIPNAILATNGICPVGASTSFNVPLQAGRTYIITLNTLQAGYDPYLWLYGPNGQLVALDDNGGGFPNSRIIYTPIVSGNYMITCGSAMNLSGGAFSLQVK